MRKKLDTRFPAARIKKIMQADEDVGKIAMAVPLLVSKALELFLQDLCDHTYNITVKRGAKTLNSLHLKQCVQSFNVFDFLREIVGKVPDLGASDAAAGEDRSAIKRRKVANDDNHDSDDEPKRGRLQECVQVNASGRKRGRGRPSKADREAEKHPKIILKQNLEEEDVDSKDNHLAKTNDSTPVHNFDLNLDLDENGDTPPVGSSTDSHTICAPPVGPSPNPNLEMKEYPGWSMVDVEKMAIDRMKLANLNNRVDEEEEDYDEEE